MKVLARLALVALAACPSAASAQGHLLADCSRGHLQVCQALLARPRLDAGRRAAIEFLLAEIDRLSIACGAGTESACEELTRNHPALPADMRTPHKR